MSPIRRHMLHVPYSVQSMQTVLNPSYAYESSSCVNSDDQGKGLDLGALCDSQVLLIYGKKSKLQIEQQQK